MKSKPPFDVAGPAGRPAVMRPKRSLWVTFYLVSSLLGLGAYGATALRGKTWFGDGGDRDVIPASVRASPGGYRSFHFWHSGYMGGK